VIQQSLKDKQAQVAEGIPEQNKDMIIARELEINGIETGAYDPLARGWVFYGLTCFLQDAKCWMIFSGKNCLFLQKVVALLSKRVPEALERLNKKTIDEFMASIKNVKAESNLAS